MLQAVTPQQRTGGKMLWWDLHHLQEDRPNWCLVHHPHRYLELELTSSLTLVFLGLFCKKKPTQTKLSFSFSIPDTTPISPAVLAAFAWDINIPVVISVSKHGRNSNCRSVEAGEDSRFWGLETSRKGLADELKCIWCFCEFTEKSRNMCKVNLQLKVLCNFCSL